jgi:hypothetical protein
MTRFSLALVVVALAACAPQQQGDGSSAGSPATASDLPTDAAALGPGEEELDAGTHLIDLASLAGGPEYPTFEITVPDGWVSPDGWSLARPAEGQGAPSVAVTFWNVDQVYGHPCEWAGTEFQPGPDAESLADALIEVPMRNATAPRAVTLNGYDGEYLEWTVPDDIDVDAEGNFPGCDETTDGHRDFRSWTGLGWADARFQQGPGQVDRLWILDVGGHRLVIDAFSMPWAAEADVAEMLTVVESIQFAGN